MGRSSNVSLFTVRLSFDNFGQRPRDVSMGIIYDKRTLKTIKPLHHVRKGNAVFTKTQNTSISGVFVFDRRYGRHCFFENPYAEQPLQKSVFDDLHFVSLSKDTMEKELTALGNMMFWNVNQN